MDSFRRHVVGGAVVAFGALVFTTGPLYRVRSWWNYDDPLAADLAVVAVQVLFGLMGLGVLVSGARWRRVEVRLAGIAAALVTWMALSAAWSADAGATLRESVMVAITLLAGIGAAVAVSERVLVFAGWVGVHVGLAWSALWIVTLQPGTQSDDGWTGVYFNPNSLALVAAVGILLSLVLAARHLRHRHRWPIAAVLAVAVVADAWLISGTASLAPAAALLVGLAVAAAAVAARRLVRPGGLLEGRARGVAALVGVGAVVVTMFAFATRTTWLDRFGRSSTLTGRTEIWGVALDWWRDQPIRGHGYLGAWADPQFVADQIAARGELLGSTHNTFVELLLGTGVIGFALAVALVVGLWTAAGHRALTGVRWADAWPMAALVFVIVENLAETLWVGGQVSVVLVGVLIVVSTTSDSTDTDDAGSPRPPEEPATERPGIDPGGAAGADHDGIADHRTAEVVRGERVD